jgi:hypothetical protein
MNSHHDGILPLQDSDYQELEYLLQNYATKLSPEAKAIIAQALKVGKRKNRPLTTEIIPSANVRQIDSRF